LIGIPEEMQGGEVKLDGAERNRDAALITSFPIRRRWPSAKKRGAALFHISGALTLEHDDRAFDGGAMDTKNYQDPVCGRQGTHPGPWAGETISSAFLLAVDFGCRDLQVDG